MKARIRRIDQSIPLPEYKTSGAAAMDLASREDITIAPRSIGYVHLNVSIEPPAGHFVLMAPRSSLHKRGLMFANSVGVFDEDYSGDEDEYKAILYNFSDEPVQVQKGERICQIMILPVDRVEWEEVETLENPTRGGIGSTGVV